MAKRRGQVLAKQRIKEEAKTDERQRQPHDPPRRLEQQRQGQRADDEIRGRGIPCAQDQVALEVPVIEGEREGEHAGRPQQHPERRLPPRRALRAVGGRVFRGDAEDRQDQKADVDRPDDLTRQRRIGRGHDLEGAKGDGDPEQRPPRSEDARIGRRRGRRDRARRVTPRCGGRAVGHARRLAYLRTPFSR